MMKQTRLHLFVALCLAWASPLRAQQPSPTAAASPTADPKDVATPDAIIAALYESNSVLVDQKRGADRFRSLFLSTALLRPTQFGPAGPRMAAMGVDDYVANALRGSPRHGFSEREIARSMDAFGHIMQLFSTYEARRDSTDQHPTRGINGIQLFNDGSRWWVVTVIWDNERPDNRIPDVYLKSRPALR
jgi:hypothetical protein